MVLSKMLKSATASRLSEHVQVTTCNSTSIQNWGQYWYSSLRCTSCTTFTLAHELRKLNSNIQQEVIFSLASQVDGADIFTNNSTCCALKRFQAERKYFVSLTCSQCQSYIRQPVYSISASF